MLRDKGPASVGDHPSVQRRAPHWGSALDCSGPSEACWEGGGGAGGADTITATITERWRRQTWAYQQD